MFRGGVPLYPLLHEQGVAMDRSVPRLGTPKAFDRVSISAKRVINGQADVNQLVPIAYKPKNGS